MFPLPLAFFSFLPRPGTVDGSCCAGWDRVSCEFDVLAGEPAGPNRHNFQMAQILDHEKVLFFPTLPPLSHICPFPILCVIGTQRLCLMLLLQMFFVCEKADQAPSVSIEASRIPASEKHEGFSYAFWFKPEEEIDNNPHSLIARGNSFAVNTVGANLVVRHGGAECQSPNVIAKDKWIQVFPFSFSRNWCVMGVVAGCVVSEGWRQRCDLCEWQANVF